MNETLSSNLHDSLDLVALKQQGKLVRSQFIKGKRGRLYARIFLGLTLTFGIYFRFLTGISSASLSDSFGLLLMIMVAVPTAVIAGIVLFILSYRPYSRYIQRVNDFAPNFVPRTKKVYLKFFRPITTLVYVLVILAFLLVESNLLRFGLIVIVYIYLVIYSRFLAWTLKGGLPRIEKVLRYWPNNALLLDIKISLLINMGRMEEAESLSHELLMRADVLSLSRAWLRVNKLGYALTMNGQYEKALPILEAAIQILPAHSDTYANLALWYLEQKIDPDRALELSEIVLDFAEPELKGMSVLYLASIAHALALTGQDSRAESTLKAALKHSSKLPAPGLAEVHRQAGYVRLIQNNRDAAIEHFHKTIEVDPNGIHGKLARKALEAENLQPAP